MITDKGKKSRERIISAAMQLFKLKGYLQTSVSEICQDAQVATGTFYHYFKSKQDILNGYVAQENQGMQAYYQSLHESSYAQTILKVVDYKVEIFTNNGRNLVADLISVVLPKPGTFNVLEYEFTAITADAYRKGQLAGEFTSEISPESFANTAACIFFFTAIQWSYQPNFPALPVTLHEKFVEILKLHQQK
ncbi:MAG: hypothetical protein CVU39_16230 [Chloroflexi bacterium HGW-Chloroflexi-10]|nr:MAG: hypothetical protein CVU39_16230 [Chloroflexi bacterium HGW-Chloroflexi-10]